MGDAMFNFCTGIVLLMAVNWLGARNTGDEDQELTMQEHVYAGSVTRAVTR